MTYLQKKDQGIFAGFGRAHGRSHSAGIFGGTDDSPVFVGEYTYLGADPAAAPSTSGLGMIGGAIAGGAAIGILTKKPVLGVLGALAGAVIGAMATKKPAGAVPPAVAPLTAAASETPDDE